MASDEEHQDWRVAAMDSFERSERQIHKAPESELASIRAQLAVAASNLALYDVLIAVRDEIEAAPARLRKQ